MSLMESLSHKGQVAALPVRGKRGVYEVLMVTSRDSGRWIIPKGWPMKGLKDCDAAAQEAKEEAGVTGRIHRYPLGAYTYRKRTADSFETVSVMVYLLDVENERDHWRERGQRRRQWMKPGDAAAMVQEPGLAEILSRVNAKPDARTVVLKRS